MTLASSEVRKVLKDDFVCSWHDATNDPETGQSLAHAPKEKADRQMRRGGGEHNVQILFLTPEGAVFHANAGYVAPKDFLVELAFAKKVYASVRAATVDPAAVLSRMQTIAAADARRRPDAVSPEMRKWGVYDTVVLAREFVANHPLLPAEDYRPSYVFGPGRGVFFGAGKTKHGLLGTQSPVTPPEERAMTFVAGSEKEWETLAKSLLRTAPKAAAPQKAWTDEEVVEAAKAAASKR